MLARRFGRDGLLQVDYATQVSASSPGMLRSLNVWTPFALGYLPNHSARSAVNVIYYLFIHRFVVVYTAAFSYLTIVH